MPPGDIEKIRAYITGYGHLYIRASVIRQLRDAGYTQFDIDTAWATLDAEGSLVTARLNTESPRAGWLATDRAVLSAQFWAALLGTITVSYTLAGVLLSLIYSVPSEFSGNAIYLAWGLFGLAQIMALILAYSRFRTHRPQALGVLIGLLLADIVLPLLAGALFFGLCIAPAYFYNPNP